MNARSHRGVRIHPATAVAIVMGVLLVLAGRFGAFAQRPSAAPDPNNNPNAPTGRASSMETLVWDFPTTPLGPMRAVVLLPRRRAATDRFPLLVAMHGLGETHRGVQRGAFGWATDYELGACDRVLRGGRLHSDSFFGLITRPRLHALQQSVSQTPYRGVVVVTPFTPDVLRDLDGATHQAFDRWIVEELVPKARRDLPVLVTREATGIDGVSLGGLHALWTGLGHPETFGVVGAMQAAVRNRQDRVAARYVPSPTRPSQRVRLATSDHDVLRPDVEALDALFTQSAIVHELKMLTGPHDYIFNRAPGGIEMLLFHDRALRGEASP